MLNVGLTGGIGSGKSTVARLLAELGAVVVDADAVAREVLAPGSAGLARVAERFGADVIDVDGALDRARLAAIIFDDEAARRDLEAITHPLIEERSTELMSAAGSDRVVVHDVPLLVEKHLGPAYHLVVVVDAPAPLRLRRLVEQRGMNDADARARMDHQATDEQRRCAADVLIDNTGDVDSLRAQVERLWHERLVPFEKNLRTRRRHRRPDQPVLVDYDPTWPHQAARLIDRLQGVLLSRAPEIEHVGSTAVAGMPGKDVIDLQIGVRHLTDADDPQFVATMAVLGFPRVDEIRMDHPTDAVPDPSLWVKRFHGSADPGRVVHVHVRESGSAGWQYALLFRDWLRACPDAAQEYVETKRQLAAQSESTTAYAEAKEPWFNEVWPRMIAWAQRTGWKA